GGKQASYEQILAAEMNANKAAIMARDKRLERGGGTDMGHARGMIYSEEQFVAFAKETIAKRDALKEKTLPWGGGDPPIVNANGELDRNLSRVARSKAFDALKLDEKQRTTLKELLAYLDRVNTLDYIVRFHSDHVGDAETNVRNSIGLVEGLKKGSHVDAVE